MCNFVFHGTSEHYSPTNFHVLILLGKFSKLCNTGSQTLPHYVLEGNSSLPMNVYSDNFICYLPPIWQVLDIYSKVRYLSMQLHRHILARVYFILASLGESLKPEKHTQMCWDESGSSIQNSRWQDCLEVYQAYSAPTLALIFLWSKILDFASTKLKESYSCAPWDWLPFIWEE